MFRKQLLVSIVLAAMAAFLFGCGDDTTAPEIPTINDEAPMLAPTNVVARVTSNGIELSWDPNAQLHLRGYNVYRLDESAGTIRRLNASAIPHNWYTDGSVEAGNRYEYTVTSVSIKGAESRPAFVTVVTEPVPRGKDVRDQG